jgi:hypothetical protein
MGLLDLASSLGGSRVAEQRGGAKNKLRPLMGRRHTMPTEDQISTRSHQGLPQEGGVELSLDDLAKGLATGTLSRGKALRWMGGALLGTALASFPGVAWANDCRRLGRECRRDSQCCSRNCVRRGDDKVCGCPEGKRRCGDRCVNRETNENHCGSCFNSCEEGEECVDGECGGGCPSGRVPCATGTCGTCCLEGWECVEGVCTIVCTPSCPEGCNCQLSADGGANVCIASGGAPIVSSCAECPTADFPENTECIKQGGCGAEPFLACARPCPQPI